jgi:hypothetical protein
MAMACAAAYLNHGDVGDVRNAIRNMGKTMGKLGKTDCNWPFYIIYSKSKKCPEVRFMIRNVI